MPTLEIYTTGGGYYITDIMNFLAMFSSGSQFQDMIGVGLIVGVLFLVIKIVVTGRMEGTVQYIVMVAVVSGLSIGAKARVVVVDSTYPLGIYATVDNVPFSVAYAAHLTTTVSEELTNRMETLLSPPDDLSYQKYGMLFGANLMAQSARWRAVSATVHGNLVNFLENCMIDGANIGLVDLDGLLKSGNLTSFISANVPSSLAYFDLSTNATTRCSDGWAGLNTAMTQEVNKVLQKQAAVLAPTEGVAAGVANVGAITGPLTDFQNLMGYTGADAVSYLRQAMTVNAMDDSVNRLIANSGNSAAMQLYQTTRADIQTKASYSAITAGAMKWVPLIKVTFETLYYGAFPLALVLMLTPMAMMVIKGYFGGFVWLAAWEPLNAILHTIVTKAATGYYREHTTTVSGVGTEQVLNWTNHLAVHAVEQDIASVAGFMMMSIPFLSTAIFFGAGRIAGLATSMLNVSQGAAIETGREAATGSMALGNVSMNNMAANKWNTSSVRDTGRATQTLSDGSLVTRNYDGSQTFSAGSAISNVGVTATVGQSVRSELSTREAWADRAVSSATEDFTKAITSTSSRLSEFAKSAGSLNSAGIRQTAGWSASQRKAWDENWSQVEKVAEQHGVSTSIAMQAMLTGDASFRGGLPGMAAAGARGAINNTLDANSREGFDKIYSAAKNGSYSKLISQVEEAADNAYSDQGVTEGTSETNSLRSSLDRLENSSVRLTDAYETQQSLEKAKALLTGQSAAYDTKITDAFSERLQKDGYSSEQIGKILNPKSAAGIKQQRSLLDQYMPGILDELGVLDQSIGQKPAHVMANSPRELQHQAIDHNMKQELQQPNSGWAKMSEVSSSWYDQHNSDAIKGLQQGRRVQGGVNREQKVIGKEADRWVPDALARRMGDAVTFGGGSDPMDRKSGSGYIGRGGLYNADNIRYEMGPETVRDLPPSPETVKHVAQAVAEMGSEYGFVVTSAGQPHTGVEGVDRIGSHRHDVNEPLSAVDGYLTKNGRRLDPTTDRQDYMEFISSAAKHFPGIGHYEWGVHVGGGSPGFWGPDTTRNSAAEDYLSAYSHGRAQRTTK